MIVAGERSILARIKLEYNLVVNMMTGHGLKSPQVTWCMETAVNQQLYAIMASQELTYEGQLNFRKTATTFL